MIDASTRPLPPIVPVDVKVRDSVVSAAHARRRPAERSPLEATSLASICLQSQVLAETLVDCDWEPNRSTVHNFNRHLSRGYDAVRDFLALHYRFNRRIDSPFWRECLEKVELHHVNKVVDFYKENGPSVLWRRILFDETDGREFGMEGYLAMLVGMCAPYQTKFKPSEQERKNWAIIQQAVRNRVANAFTVPEALALVRSDQWRWPEKLYARAHAERP